MSDELRDRIELAISRVPAARAADAVLREIETTHVIARPADITVVALGDLIVRAIDKTEAQGSTRKYEVGSTVIEGLRSLGIRLVEVDES